MESSIRPVTLDDVVGLERYEAVRDDVRRRIIELKRARRLSVGPEVTFVFENHDTVYFQIQEMLRAERITDLDAVREELAVYNALLPRPGELSATMLIEITEPERRRRAPARASSASTRRCRCRSARRSASRREFEPGRSREDKLSAVQYVRFALPPAARRAFLDPSVPVRLVIDHPALPRTSPPSTGAIRASLGDDLRAAE